MGPAVHPGVQVGSALTLSRVEIGSYRSPVCSREKSGWNDGDDNGIVLGWRSLSFIWCRATAYRTASYHMPQINHNGTSISCYKCTPRQLKMGCLPNPEPHPWVIECRVPKCMAHVIH